MKRKIIAGVLILLVLGGGAWWLRRRRAAAEEKPEIVTATVTRGDLVVEVTAPGVLEPLTTVEVKSRSGGEITHIFVEPGDYVHAGDKIAQLDPTELQSQVDQRAAQVRSARARLEQARLTAESEAASSKATLAQAEASLEAARARVKQAREQLALTREQANADVKQAEASLEAAKARLAEAEAQAKAQPQLTDTQIAQNRAAVKAAEEELNSLLAGSRPQEIARAEAAVRQAQADVENAKKNLDRQKALLEKGFVAQQAVDDAEHVYQTALANLASAQASLDLAKEGPREEDIRQARARLEQARAALRQAEARQVDVQVTQQQVEAARAAVRQAEAALAVAKAGQRQVQLREQELQSSLASLKEAQASLERARKSGLDVAAREKEVSVAAASLSQARASLDDVEYSFRHTTIFAPRDGIVLTKPVEEGTVIPAGTALYAQGTTIVTLADVSKMYVMAKVDESDIGQVKPGQPATISLEVLPNRRLRGKVIKVYPHAETQQEVVYYNVRVQLLDIPPQVRPGMTANVVITVAKLEKVLKIPDAAVDRSEGKTRVDVLVNGEPVKREVKLGLTNWNETQVLEGLKEGDQVVLPSAAAGEEAGGMANKGKEDRGKTARRSTFIIRTSTSKGGKGK